MPFILGALALLAGAWFWLHRARNAAHMTSDLLDMAADVHAAARRFGFRRQVNVHPVEQIEDPKVAIAAIGVSFLELDDYPTAEQRDALVRGLRDGFHVSHKDSEELVVLGRWIMTQCGDAAQAVPRLSRKLYKLSGQRDFNALVEIVQDIAKYGKGELTSAQHSALEDLQRGLKLA